MINKLLLIANTSCKFGKAQCFAYLSKWNETYKYFHIISFDSDTYI